MVQQQQLAALVAEEEEEVVVVTKIVLKSMLVQKFIHEIVVVAMNHQFLHVMFINVEGLLCMHIKV